MTPQRLTPGAFLAVFVLAGCVSALQARANGELTHHVGNGVLAAVWSFSSSFAIMCAIGIASRSTREGVGRIRVALREGSLPWWALPSGVLGGIYIACQSIAAAILGVALFAIGMVAGQVGNGLLVDRIGLGPLGRVPASRQRIAGALLALLAVAIAATGKVQLAGIPPLAALLAVFAGAVVAVQHGLNGRVSAAARQPISATWVMFGFGAVALWIAGAVAVGMGAQVRIPDDGPWWMYLGGVFGITFIITASWAVPRIGVLSFGLISIAGQLAAAVVLDLVSPMGAPGLPLAVILGAGLTLLAVAVSGYRPGSARTARSRGFARIGS